MFCAIDVLYIYFLKMCLVWKYGEYNKSYVHGRRVCHLEGLSVFFIWSSWMTCRKNRCRFHPQLLKNSFRQRVCLLCIVIQLVNMLSCLLPCPGWPANDISHAAFYASPAKLHENIGAKMTSRSAKKFPVQIREAKRVKITLPRFSFLTAADFSKK